VVKQSRKEHKQATGLGKVWGKNQKIVFGTSAEHDYLERRHHVAELKLKYTHIS